jgi:phenylacetate-CoA ligase
MRQSLVFLFLRLARAFRWVIGHNETSYRLLFIGGLEKTRWQVGKWKAWQAYSLARLSVPAYSDFLKHQPDVAIPLRGFDPDLTVIPVMDKESYVKKYSIEERCIGGVIPSRGVVIDESSGTSGTPNNWVRGPKERADVKKIVQVSLQTVVGKKPIFLINAFALGPWATGMNVSMSLADVTIIKSTGPDISKIINTLKLFGERYDYVLMGYPPFLKTLVDSADISWKKYRIVSIYGGEGMSEGLRDYLLGFFQKIYGSYGASDLEINIGAENDFTIALRKFLITNKKLSRDLIRPGGLVPMIFQYNPLDYYIETNAEGELLVTLCRASNVAPKIRYNIHDLGHVLRLPELKVILDEHNISLNTLGTPTSDLPLLFHYGRSDAAVSFYGSKISPMEIQQIIVTNDTYNSSVNTFSLITNEDAQHNKHLILAFELKKGQEPQMEQTDSWREAIFNQLKEINQDYKESSKMIPENCQPELHLYPFGEGVFENRDIRLKQKYIIESS